jgi:preprotein translocase subunit YajC
VGFLIVMVLILVVMYVLMIRPQRQRQREQQLMIEGASVGDDILTTGGIYGTITEAEGDDIVVEIAEGLSVHMTRRGIAAVLPPEEDEDEPAELEAGQLEEEIAEEVEHPSGEADRADDEQPEGVRAR